MSKNKKHKNKDKKKSKQKSVQPVQTPLLEKQEEAKPFWLLNWIGFSSILVLSTAFLYFYGSLWLQYYIQYFGLEYIPLQPPFYDLMGIGLLRVYEHIFPWSNLAKIVALATLPVLIVNWVLYMKRTNSDGIEIEDDDPKALQAIGKFFKYINEFVLTVCTIFLLAMFLFWGIANLVKGAIYDGEDYAEDLMYSYQYHLDEFSGTSEYYSDIANVYLVGDEDKASYEDVVVLYCSQSACGVFDGDKSVLLYKESIERIEYPKNSKFDVKGLDDAKKRYEADKAEDMKE